LGAKLKTNMGNVYKIKDKDITDIAIRITNMLIEKGLIIDCAEMDNQEENEEKDMQDEIKAILNDYTLQN
jgi:hypothetical protein